MSHDLGKCPRCGGSADNGHDREYPPNPYVCTKCEYKDKCVQAILFIKYWLQEPVEVNANTSYSAGYTKAAQDIAAIIRAYLNE